MFNGEIRNNYPKFIGNVSLKPFSITILDRTVLQVDRLELIDALMNLCTYRHPENIALPAG